MMFPMVATIINQFEKLKLSMKKRKPKNEGHDISDDMNSSVDEILQQQH